MVHKIEENYYKLFHKNCVLYLVYSFIGDQKNIQIDQKISVHRSYFTLTAVYSTDSINRRKIVS